jgi:crossover junction endodeoxyribonuclease RusA
VTVTLAWPHPYMWPNSRKHRLKVAPFRAQYRRDCGLLAMAAKMRFPHLAEIGCHLNITFCPPNDIKRDLDNMLAAIKSGLDGLSDVMGVDDSKWSMTIQRGPKTKGGAVIVTVAPAVVVEA